VFESILHRPSQQLGDVTMALTGDDSVTEVIDTPSRTSKKVLGQNGNGSVRKARFDVPEESESAWKEDPIHQQAGYGYAW